MIFRIADTFTASLARLTGQEQKTVKLTAFDLQTNPANPGLRFHKLDRARDPNFWSVRVNRDLRIIVHKTEAGLLLAHTGHHDDAYRWAERRRIDTHPRTGAAQLVELPEALPDETTTSWSHEYSSPETSAATPERPPPRPLGAEQFLPPLFNALSEEDVLDVGVPEEWVGEILGASEDSFLDLYEHLPPEAAEALMEYVVSGTFARPENVTFGTGPFEHPDAMRRFRTMENVAELGRALEFPWEKWTLFLHPIQRRTVEHEYTGPTRISGSAGTGKTVVALHRAVVLARRNATARVLLTTFSETLAHALSTKIARLIGEEPGLADRITVAPVGGVARALYGARHGEVKLASPDTVADVLNDAMAAIDGANFSRVFIRAEWENVFDAWQITDWEAYRDVPRLGRRTRIGGRQREVLWQVFDRARAVLAERGLITRARMLGLATETGGGAYDFAVVDEAQDMGVAELRFLAAIAGDSPDALFFTGDLGQRIFQQPFSWLALGIDIRGRSQVLQVNYRTSHQIRTGADRLLPSTLADVDGNEENRLGTVSVFNGPLPEIRILDTVEQELKSVAEWIGELVEDGTAAHEIGLFVRSVDQMSRARNALDTAGLDFVELTETVETSADRVSLATMHLAKGLEFKAVAVMACDDEIVPSQARIETVADTSDLEDIYETERHLLYVACTRARERLLVTGVEPASEFLEDLNG
jgi:hypothetical protein